MELYIGQDKQGNIHITDDHKQLPLPSQLVRSYFMNFPGKRDVTVIFDGLALKNLISDPIIGTIRTNSIKEDHNE